MENNIVTLKNKQLNLEILNNIYRLKFKICFPRIYTEKKNQHFAVYPL